MNKRENENGCAGLWAERAEGWLVKYLSVDSVEEGRARGSRERVADLRGAKRRRSL